MHEAPPDELRSITYSNLDKFIQQHANPEVTEKTLWVGEPLRLGDIGSSQGDREHYGPFFVAYAAERAKPLEETPGQISLEATVVISAMTDLYAARDTDPRYFRELLKQSMKTARDQAAQVPYVRAAGRTIEILHDFEAETVAEDALAAGGLALQLRAADSSPEDNATIPVQQSPGPYDSATISIQD